VPSPPFVGYQSSDRQEGVGVVVHKERLIDLDVPVEVPVT
jgi:hypothetical protein